jgi:RNA polymerase sigma-70 factor (ECF subfamily)
MTEPQGHSAILQSLLDEAAPGGGASERLIAHAWDRLLRLTRKMLRNYPHLRRWEQTEDVFQTAAIRLYRSLAEVRPATLPEFFGLAATQIRRTLIDLARHHFGPHGQAAHHHSDRGHADTLGREPADSCRPETLLEWTEFHEAVERLPAAERDVFHMIWYGGLEQSEAARLLGVSVPTVQRESS